MSLPYIPGWWDEISKSATSFASQLPQIIQPDSVAQKRLQEMIQQNPMLLSQIENMTPEARRSMEQTLGFKNKNPLQSLPVGAQLKQQMADAKYLETLTPEQQDIRQAARVGTLSLPELQRKKTKESQEDQKFQMDLNNGTLQNQVLTGQAKEVERIGKQVESALAKYPTLQGIDINKIVKGAVRSGAPVDPQLITAIQSDPGAKQLFDIAYTSELTKFKNELDTRLAKSRSTQDETLLLRTLAEIGNQLNDQEARTISELNIELGNFEKEQSNPANLIANLNNPNAVAQKKAEITKRYENRLTQIRNAANINTERTTNLVDKLGLKSPTSAGSAPPPTSAGMNTPVGPTVDAEARLALDAIRQQPQNEMSIRAAYKQRTGRDLP
jgi:hypothetical protein